MSTERPEKDVTGPRRGRSPLAVVSVAAAVLLAGGGAAYWASASQGRAAPASGGGAPPPLALSAQDASAQDASAPAPGIAVGEPDPYGGRVVHRVAGELPSGPAEAAVHRARGAVTAAEVTRLAEALGVRGAPRTEGAAWAVGGDGSGPYLRVTKRAPGSWTFARYGSGGPDACGPAAPCEGETRGTGSGEPVGEEAAEAAAAPVLKAVGQDGAALDARQVMGSARVVNADPVVGGLPTYGWSTGIQVGSGGEIVGGSGHLKSLEKGDAYPLIGARAALDLLDAESRPGAKPAVGGCATSVPLADDVSSATAGCVSRSGSARPVTTVTVEKAVLGLSARYADGEQVLVPSWLFSLRPVDGGAVTTLARVAVDPAYLTGESARPTDGPVSGGERQVLSYSADGRTLDVTFWGGVCSAYDADVEEDGSTVRVTVTESEPEPGKACVMIAKELTRTVTLDAPLGDREVVDAGSGAVVPRV